jgi:hypothetical protein
MRDGRLVVDDENRAFGAFGRSARAGLRECYAERGAR